MIANNEEKTIREVIRGERPWSDLRALGMKLDPESGYAADLTSVGAKVNIHDLATGFAAHLHDPASLRAWAFVLEALDADFEPIEAHPKGGAVLDALWSASFGDPLAADAVALIRTLAEEHASER